MSNDAPDTEYDSEDDLKSYEHIPYTVARDIFATALQKRYRVATINWTFGTTDEGNIDWVSDLPTKSMKEFSQKDAPFAKVHRNVYSFTLRNLIKFIRETAEVAEDIISIELEPATVRVAVEYQPAEPKEALQVEVQYEEPKNKSVKIPNRKGKR